MRQKDLVGVVVPAFAGSTRGSILVAAALLACSVTSAMAEVAIAFPLPQSTLGNFVNGVVGFDFTPINSLRVTALGYYDHGGDGLVVSHPVAIYQVSTQTLVSPIAIVSTASVLDPSTNFRYESVPEFVLTAGITYAIVGYGESVNGHWDQEIINPVGLVFGPSVSFSRVRGSLSSGLEFPTTAGESGVQQGLYGDANFRYTVIPSPCSAALFGFGGCVMARRRRG